MELMRLFITDETNSLNLQHHLRSTPGIELIGEANSFSLAMQKLNVVVPDLILYCPREDGSEFRRIKEISNLSSQSSIMILAQHTDSDYVRDCLRAGAHDYFLLPYDIEMLQKEIEKAYQRHVRRRHKETLSVLMDRFTGKPKLVGFISGKGGVGKTTLAVNAGAALAQQGKKVVLVDLDANMGGADVFLKLNPVRTLADLRSDQVDDWSEKIVDYLEFHSSGLAVLCSGPLSVHSGLMPPTRLRVIFQALQRHFQYVLVDLPPTVDNCFLSVLETADECFMVSTPSLAVLSVNRRLLELFYNLGYDTDKVEHILNCVGVKHGVTRQDAERLLKTTIRLSIEYNFPRVEMAINTGIPLTDSTMRSPFAKPFAELGRIISGSRTSKKIEGAAKNEATMN